MQNITVSDYWKRNYECYYEEGDSLWRRLGAIDKARNITDLCQSVPHDSVLEIGAGEGSILKRLSEVNFGKELHALDISRTGIETIKEKRIPNLRESTVFDGYNIPYENKRFDLVILSHVIEHAEYPRKLLYEASRVAKYIFVEVPLEDTVRLKADFILDKVGHINFYSPKTIRRLLQTCNLQVLCQKNTNSSKEIFVYRKGKIGVLACNLKGVFLSCFPSIATSVFTYHSALLCACTD